MSNLCYALSCLLCLSITAPAQEGSKRGQAKYVIVPPEVVPLAIATQPDCPLQLEGAKLLLDVEKMDTKYGFEFRNRGAKPIVGFTVDSWFVPGAAGGTVTPWRETENPPLMPGQVITFADQKSPHIVPLTEELRTKLKMQGAAKGVTIFIVREVIFSDRTSYRAMKTSDALSAYLGALHKVPEAADEK